MNKVFSISKYEYKMQIKRVSGWLVLLFVVIATMMDCLPTTNNMKRIEFLYDVHYYVRRVFAFDGLILLFALMFLMADRLVSDRKMGRRDLFMVTPIRKQSYIVGKLLGNFLYALSFMYLLLIAALIGFAVFNHVETSVKDYISSCWEVSIYIIIPATFFVTTSSVILPELINLRLFYLLFSVLFLTNVLSVETGATPAPFYIFTQGDVSKMIWQHPRWPTIYIESAFLNLLFMLGIGGLSILLIFVKRKFWRDN
ncbi:putative uncharacterized protein [Firmicutes bacterium CAG:646]|nr:putative uncharacterized protein [Firmicutes bacterium CAG:646]